MILICKMDGRKKRKKQQTFKCATTKTGVKQEKNQGVNYEMTVRLEEVK